MRETNDAKIEVRRSHPSDPHNKIGYAIDTETGPTFATKQHISVDTQNKISKSHAR